MLPSPGTCLLTSFCTFLTIFLAVSWSDLDSRSWKAVARSVQQEHVLTFFFVSVSLSDGSSSSSEFSVYLPAFVDPLFDLRTSDGSVSLFEGPRFRLAGGSRDLLNAGYDIRRAHVLCTKKNATHVAPKVVFFG